MEVVIFSLEGMVYM